MGPIPSWKHGLDGGDGKVRQEALLPVGRPVSLHSVYPTGWRTGREWNRSVGGNWRVCLQIVSSVRKN